MKHEALFQKQLTETAPLFGCKIITIPDFIPIKGNKIIAHKRPFDGILITAQQNYCLELKFNYSPLRPHQRKTMQEINDVNQSYFVVRKIVYKTGLTRYEIKQGKLIFTTNDITKIFAFFRDPREYISQEAMLDQLIPEKKKKKLLRRVLG